MEVTIRFAETSDTDALKTIWKICFGDGDAYINFFYEHCFCAENTVVASIDNQVVGVVYMLPAVFGDKTFLYGYAVGVLPEFRGNNICEKMHIFIKKYAEKNGFVYGLHPANTKLFDYYRRIGLHDMYTLRTYDASSCEIGASYTIQDVSPEEYFCLRKLCFPHMVLWEENMISYICKEAVQFGGFVKKIWIGAEERIFLAKKNNDMLYIKETTMTDPEIQQASGYIKEYFDVKQMIFTLPNTSDLGTEEVMILGFGEKNTDVYMNLFLD